MVRSVQRGSAGGEGGEGGWNGGARVSAVGCEGPGRRAVRGSPLSDKLPSSQYIACDPFMSSLMNPCIIPSSGPHSIHSSQRGNMHTNFLLEAHV